MSSEWQKRDEESASQIVNVLIIGFWGGILWSFIGIVACFFNFMKFSPKIILTSWSGAHWIEGWLGTIITLLIYSILSMAAALLYYSLLKKFQNMMAGIIYGAVLWILLFFILKPVFSGLPSIEQLKGNTGITSFCIFILYGVFIGSSISYEYQEKQKKNVPDMKTT
ncbi:YqhR family membrane protein [Actinomycetes bacterium NPDC127524]